MKLNRLFILGACSIAFLASCGCSNNSDQKVLDNINAILKNNAESIHTCYDAVSKVESEGIELNDHKFANENYEFVYDSKAKQFVIMDGDSIVKNSEGYEKSENTLDYFKSVYIYNPNSKYSQYLDKRAEVPEQLLITTGFDIGSHIDIPNIGYVNLSNNPQEVIIRTYSDYFSVLAPLDTVHHYEIATNVIVTDVKTLDMHSETGYVNAQSGYVYFGSDSTTSFFEVKEGCEEDVSIDVASDAKFYATINIDHTKSGDPFPAITVTLASTSVSTLSELKDALKPTAEGGTPFIRLTNDITYESDDNISLVKDVCIDLAGYKISFEGGDVDNHRAIEVIKNYNLYLFDSQGVLDDNSGIELDGCCIYINAGAGNSSSLVINGGKITHKANENASAAVQCVGDITGVATVKSNFTMYGGKIESTMQDTTESTCLTTYGEGATADIVYGNFISDAECIAFNYTGAPSTYGNSVVTINGGHFTSSVKQRGSCIEYGPGFATNITINGGTFAGASCLTIADGNVKISNAKFNANGQYRNYPYGADGSTINVYNNTDITIDVNDVMMYSKFAYVISSQDSAKGTINFHEGSYSYYLDGEGYAVSGGVNVNIDNKNNFTQHELN